MQPNYEKRRVKQQGVQAQGLFDISQNEQDRAFIIDILRNRIYTDKILAVLREYASNAWDAHQEVGKGDLPIKVVLPTSLESTLVIRDWGPGLSDEDVFNLYTQYGSSTKRDSNIPVGMMGLGSKAGFAYSDSFTVTSWHEGFKRVYTAILNETNAGEMKRLYEGPCDPSETGIEIKVPVRPLDCDQFEYRAKELFTHFEPQPEINCVLPTLDKQVTPHGYILSSGRGGEWRGWVAIMGCVPYRINIQQIRDALADLGIWNVVYQMSGGLHFNIGDVQMDASREELEYTESTCKKLVIKLQQVLDDYTTNLCVELDDERLNPWDKRLKAREITRSLRLPLPKKYAPWASELVTLWGKAVKREPPKTFKIQAHVTDKATKTLVAAIPVTHYARLVIKDDDRNIKGYSLSYRDLIVWPLKTATVEDVQAELIPLLEKAGLTGIPTLRISDVAWLDPSEKREVKVQKKYRVNTFRLENTFTNAVLSTNWVVEKREPQEDDIFVIIHHFKAVNVIGFYDKVNADKNLADHFGLNFPTIYGYKTTSRKPLVATDCLGTEYSEWRQTFFKDLVKEQAPLVRAMHWVTWGSRFGYCLRKEIPLIYEDSVKTLGEKHLLSRILRRYLDAKALIRKVGGSDQQALKTLCHLAKKASKRRPSPVTEAERLMAAYPLFKTVTRLAAILDPFEKEGHRKEWFRYMKLMDSCK